MSKLALFGGEPAVTISHPHFIWPQINGEKKKIVNELLDKGIISIYDDSGIIRTLEEDYIKYHDTKYAIATNSGTTALYSAFFGCEIGPGDEVISPTYTFLATVMPLFQLGAIPVLADCDERTGNISPTEIENSITSKTKAIVITHMWGHPCDMENILHIANKHGLKIIEDCSHAHGATYNGKKVGTFGDVACFSMQGNKIVSAGEGGMLITNSQEIYERATLLGHYRDRSQQCVTSPFYKQFSDTGFGLKLRIHPIAAALAHIDMLNLDKNIKVRNDNLNYMSSKLKNLNGITPPFTANNVFRGAYYGYKPFYSTETNDNVPIERFIEALRAEGVEAKKPGSKPLHLTKFFQTRHDGMFRGDWPKCYGFQPTRNGQFTKSEEFYNKTFSLPTFSKKDDKAIIDQYVCAMEKVLNNIELLKVK